MRFSISTAFLLSVVLVNAAPSILESTNLDIRQVGAAVRIILLLCLYLYDGDCRRQSSMSSLNGPKKWQTPLSLCQVSPSVYSTK